MAFGESFKRTGRQFWRLGMNTAASSDPRIREVRVTRDEIIAHLVDGRVISVPLAWSWRLSEATASQRQNFRLIGAGQGVHWPDVDEDLSIEGMLHGGPASRPKARPAAGVSHKTLAKTARDCPPKEKPAPVARSKK
jgi:hypothetical protein